RDHAQNVDVNKAALAVTYRDDSPSGLGSIDNLSVFRYRREIERSGVAIFGWGSWMDAATADTLIRRFVNMSNPQTEIIGAWSHGAGYDADPFHQMDAPLTPGRAEQLMEQLRFFDYYLKGAANGAKAAHTLTYYTMGEDRWKTTNVWPIQGTKTERWYLAQNNKLSTAAPASSSGEDRYSVDLNATTGGRNRWFTENGGSDVVYADRAAEDRKLLTYTSAPLMADTEITGYPIITLNISSTATDGAFFVYLEDVDEHDHVTYITEGELRALHRKISRDAPPYKMFVPFHSFKRRDGELLVPGQTATLNFGLFPTSVLLKKGHRIRIAIAGSDRPTFARIPAEGNPVITVARNRQHPSFIELPVVLRT
ncbi:MAG TPA: CocE/NonD family hydrolase, partial [Pyrinomonadaceae bacterium]|nr:CocE/NonD family hydrolase [Pyrinomonadaceae bacterium]